MYASKYEYLMNICIVPYDNWLLVSTEIENFVDTQFVKKSKAKILYRTYDETQVKVNALNLTIAWLKESLNATISSF